MSNNNFIDETSKCFLKNFDKAKVIEKDLSSSYTWQIVFQLETFTVYINSDRRFLDFQVISKSGDNLGVRYKNKKIFHDFFETTVENIHLIIDFLVKNKDEIFKSE
jgi:hypothetical protein